MLRGSAWMIALRWAVRLIGVAGTVILARLLTPTDFGVVAIAMVVVGLFEMLNMTGQGLAIIRHENPTREHYDSAWTISALIGFGIALAVFAIAPLTQAYFHEPRAVAVMQCLGLRAALGGVENIGVVDFRRDLRFERFFLYNVVTRILQFALTVGLALALHSYWALVAGILVGQLSRTVLSYFVHPYRPRLSFIRTAEIWSFSIWTFARSVASYLQTQIDNIAIGGLLGATAMGRYTVAKDVATAPTTEITEPMLLALFPVMAIVRGDLAELRKLYLRTLGWAAIISASTGVGVMLVAPDLVKVVLGPKWIDATPILGWLALNGCTIALQGGAYTILDVLGLPHIGARMQWLRLAAYSIAIIAVAWLVQDLVAIAAARVAISALLIPTVFLTVGRRVSVTAGDYASVLWRPFMAAGAMALAVLAINSVLAVSSVLRLGIDVLVGAAAYGAALLMLWILSGRPETAERDVITLVGHVSRWKQNFFQTQNS
jgi:O-antigen/teichoic acid export membrane protein